jgi:hypothetical protein
LKYNTIDGRPRYASRNVLHRVLAAGRVAHQYDFVGRPIRLPKVRNALAQLFRIPRNRPCAPAV